MSYVVIDSDRRAVGRNPYETSAAATTFAATDDDYTALTHDFDDDDIPQDFERGWYVSDDDPPVITREPTVTALDTLRQTAREVLGYFVQAYHEAIEESQFYDEPMWHLVQQSNWRYYEGAFIILYTKTVHDTDSSATEDQTLTVAERQAWADAALEGYANASTGGELVRRAWALYEAALEADSTLTFDDFVDGLKPTGPLTYVDPRIDPPRRINAGSASSLSYGTDYTLADGTAANSLELADSQLTDDFTRDGSWVWDIPE